MKIRVTDNILNYDGKPVLDGDDKGGLVPLTWRMAFRYALNTAHSVPTEVSVGGQVQYRTDEFFTSEQQEKAYEITPRLYLKDEVDLTSTQCAYIISRVKRMFENSPIVIGRTKELLGDIEKDKPELTSTEDKSTIN